jgi:hypothetical protein
MKDQVFKDLGVPCHQIEPMHFRDWKRGGFESPKLTCGGMSPLKKSRGENGRSRVAVV